MKSWFRRVFTAVCLFSLAAGSMSAATAAVVTFDFSGTIVFAGPMGVSPGTRITGTFSYDTDTEVAIKTKRLAIYTIPAPFEISATVGAHRIVASNLTVTLQNKTGGNAEDSFSIEAVMPVLDGTTFSEGVLAIVLASAPGDNSAIKNLKLPKDLDLSRFNNPGLPNYGVLQANGGPDGTLLQFSIDSLVKREQPR